MRRGFEPRINIHDQDFKWINVANTDADCNPHADANTNPYPNANPHSNTDTGYADDHAHGGNLEQYECWNSLSPDNRQ